MRTGGWALLCAVTVLGCAPILVDLEYDYLATGDRLTVDVGRCTFHFELGSPTGLKTGSGRVRLRSTEATIDETLEVSDGALRFRSAGSAVELHFGEFRARFEEGAEILVIGHDEFDLTQSPLIIEVSVDGSSSVRTP